MRTEHQLREALSSLESLAPSRDRVLPATVRRPRKRRLFTAFTVAVAGAVAVVMIVLPARTPAHRPARTVSLRSALLMAFQSASGDIVYARTWIWAAYAAKAGSVLSMAEWQVPWVIAPGETVHQRFLTPSESNPTAPFQDEAQTYVQTRSGNTPAVGEGVIVDYPARTWSASEEAITLSGGSDLATLREQVAKGQVKVVGHPVLNGQHTIELGSDWVDRSPHVMQWATTFYWVDASTYLPIQVVLHQGSIGMPKTDRIIRGVYQFLSPTPANMRLLQAPIPPGFKRVPATLPNGTIQKLPAG